MKGNTAKFIIASLCSAVLLSLGFLFPHCGAFALVGFVPLLWMDRKASLQGMKHFWIWHYLTFVSWNAITTFWVCNATVGGGIFAILANALQMSVIWAAFRLFKKKYAGNLPYIFLAAMWIAWERFYFDAEISWPWLVLGNAFAGTTTAIQWYDVTGALGGSLWIWASNLSVFGMITAFESGAWDSFNRVRRCITVCATVLIFAAPPCWSLYKFNSFRENSSSGSISTVILQPNIDPYMKFVYLSQQEQNDILTAQIGKHLPADSSQAVLFLAPETFTSDVTYNEISAGKTFRELKKSIESHSGANILFGASAYEFFHQAERPSPTACSMGRGTWYENYNAAIMMNAAGRAGIYKKSRLVVGVEKFPYPKILRWVEKYVGEGVIGHCIGQKEPSVLHFTKGPDYQESTPVGCAICYESVYPEHFAGFVKAGAQVMTVITNDAWWGDTPGYKQHLNYSRLRAIETRRDIARCANTGISAFINQRGDILDHSSWWQREELTGVINCSCAVTPFVRYGDITGRLCSFIFTLLLLAFCVRSLTLWRRR